MRTHRSNVIGYGYFFNIAVFILLLLSNDIIAQERNTSSFCELFKKPTLTKQLTTIEGFFYLSDNPSSEWYLYSPQCNSRDNIILLNTSRSKKFESVIADRVLKFGSTNRTFAVKLVGKLSIGFAAEYGELGFARAELDLDRIIYARLAAPNILPPDSTAETPIIDTARAVKYKNSDLLFSALLEGGQFPAQDLSAASIFLDGKPVSPETVKDLVKYSRDDTYIVSVKKCERLKNIWLLSGKFIIQTLESGSWELSFRNSYAVPKNGPLELVRMEISKLR